MLHHHWVSLIVISLVSMIAASDAAEDAADIATKPTLRKSDDFGLIFCYPEKVDINAFFTSTPCVSGVQWQFHEENEEHWIGELHYPTENTGGDPKMHSSNYYMVTNLAIRKQEGLPIDLKKFRGALVLRDPKPDVPLAMRGDGTTYELVGFQDKSRKDRRYRFLFGRNKQLKYAVP